MGKSELPSFSWGNEPSPFGVPFLRIAFPDQGNDDFAILKPYNPVPLAPHERSEDLDSCIYQGYLLNEKDVHVTMTGCAMSDNFKVTNCILFTFSMVAAHVKVFWLIEFAFEKSL